MRKQRIAARPLADLAPDAENPRAITPEAAAGLRFSLDRYGDLAGIVYDASAGVLVAGHQRIDQLRAAGVERWEVEREADDGLTVPDGSGVEGTGWIAHASGRFRVRLVRWTPETRREANIVANSDQIAGHWRPELLLPMLPPLLALPALAPLRFADLADDVGAPWATIGSGDGTSPGQATHWGRTAAGDPNDVPILVGDLECFAARSLVASWLSRIAATGRPVRDVAREDIEAWLRGMS